MLFWSIVLGCVAVLVLFGWRADRRTRNARRRKIYDSVRIGESDVQLKQAQTARWGIFRNY